jgi:hypothetical protein
VRRHAVLAAGLVALTLCAGTGAGAAASLVLGDAEKRQALAYGRQSAQRENFDAEWRVTNGAGDSLLVITPFHRLVIAARHSAFRDAPMRPNEPDRLLREQKDRLVLSVHLRGRGDEFSRSFVPELLVGERTVKASFVQNDRTPERIADGIVLARCTYAFPVKELEGAARVVLVVTDASGREASRFAIDLASMR